MLTMIQHICSRLMNFFYIYPFYQFNEVLNPVAIQ